MVIARTAVALLYALVRFLLVAGQAPLLAFGVAFALNAALTLAASYALYRLPGSRGKLSFTWRRARALLADSWPLIVTGAAITVYMRLDQVMLGTMAGDQATGIYATAAALSELSYMLPIAISTSVLPLLVRAQASGDPRGVSRTMQLLYDGMAASSYLVAAVVTVAARPALTLVLGPAYRPSADVLVVHVWTLLFVSLGMARSRFLVAENHTRFSIAAALLGGAVNVVLNLALIPRWGAMGAAWATLLAQVSASYASGVLDQRVRGSFLQATLALLVPFRWSALLRLGQLAAGARRAR